MKLNRAACAVLCAIVGMIAVGCAPLANIQEPNRIVLLAPFEGLYRRSGYAALDAVRAVTDSSTTVAPAAETPDRPNTKTPEYWTPTAIDTSRDPLRAAQKALAPGNAAAVIGPLIPTDAALVFPALQDSGIDWYAPFATTENGFIAPGDPAWLASLVASVASSAHANSAQYRVLIAGWEDFSTITSRDALPLDPIVPVVWLEGAATDLDVRPGDMLLWLGDAAEGVRYIAAFRAEYPDLAVFLPYWAAGDVFVEHASALDDWSWDGIEWGGWVPEDSSAVTPDTTPAVEAALIAAATAVATGAPQPGFTFISAPFTPGR